MNLKEKLKETVENKKKALEQEFDDICKKIADIYSSCYGVANIKVYCNEKTRELEFATLNHGVISMKKEDWLLSYDTYFTKTNAGVPFYDTLKEQVHEKLGIAAEFEYSENEEIPIVKALNVSISDLITKE